MGEARHVLPLNMGQNRNSKVGQRPKGPKVHMKTKGRAPGKDIYARVGVSSATSERRTKGGVEKGKKRSKTSVKAFKKATHPPPQQQPNRRRLRSVVVVSWARGWLGEASRWGRFDRLHVQSIEISKAGRRCRFRGLCWSCAGPWYLSIESFQTIKPSPIRS
jgi:hypothetical protein